MQDILFPETYVFDFLLEEGAIHDITELIAPYHDVNCRVAMTKELFEELYPYAEDKTKGILFEERIDDLMAEFKRSCQFAFEDFVQFNVKVPTYVSKKHSFHDVEVYKDGKSRTKTVPAFSCSIPDRRRNKTLIFGLAGADLVEGA